ncbi:MAG: hypothetical protein JO246_05220 [Frankiaceae bacterium]|nr:hypothetical protein [Frankiaceae bacterium]MBV9871676.1 hypothetical protein [Frankiaceae bacterium]
MPIAAFKDLCLDATDAAVLGPFWAAVLGLRWDANEPHVGRVLGPTPQHTIWFDHVPEPKTVKQRVHLDIYTRRLADLEDIGATVVATDDAWGWTVMADPEGGEFCAFRRDELPADRLHGLVVDCADPVSIATWWAEVYGADLVRHDEGYATVENVPGMPILTMDFVPVPEPKVVKNRIHWDVVAPDVGALVSNGARILRAPDEQIRWHVLADPDGNEFCAFAEG